MATVAKNRRPPKTPRQCNRTRQVDSRVSVVFCGQQVSKLKVENLGEEQSVVNKTPDQSSYVLAVLWPKIWWSSEGLQDISSKV